MAEMVVKLKFELVRVTVLYNLEMRFSDGCDIETCWKHAGYIDTYVAIRQHFLLDNKYKMFVYLKAFALYEIFFPWNVCRATIFAMQNTYIFFQKRTSAAGGGTQHVA